MRFVLAFFDDLKEKIMNRRLKIEDPTKIQIYSRHGWAIAEDLKDYINDLKSGKPEHYHGEHFHDDHFHNELAGAFVEFLDVFSGSRIPTCYWKLTEMKIEKLFMNLRFLKKLSKPHRDGGLNSAIEFVLDKTIDKICAIIFYNAKRANLEKGITEAYELAEKVVLGLEQFKQDIGESEDFRDKIYLGYWHYEYHLPAYRYPEYYQNEYPGHIKLLKIPEIDEDIKKFMQDQYDIDFKDISDVKKEEEKEYLPLEGYLCSTFDFIFKLIYKLLRISK